MHIGIDFGAKLSGKTAIAYQVGQVLIVQQASKDADADKWLSNLLIDLNPTLCFIDAPLSLPGAYFGHGNDYFFRECDRLTQAMSPMFLGGLTARAMALKNRFPAIQFVESYPKLLALSTANSEAYKTNIELFVDAMMADLPFTLGSKLSNWHQIDAVLAWLIGNRYLQGNAHSHGNPSEGLIFS